LRGEASWGNSRCRVTLAGLAVQALEIEQELAADGVDHGARMPENQPGAGTNHAGLEQRIGHPRHGLHGHNGIPNGGGGYVFLAQNAEGAKLARS